MSEFDDEYDDDEVEQDDKPERTNSEWAELRRARKAKEKAERELAAMKRQVEFAKAGIDTDDPKAKYFIAGYDGDISAEAIRAEAIKAGFIAEPADNPDQPELLQQQQIAEAATGALPEGAQGVDTGALDQAFLDGGTDGMLAYLRSQGIPINEVQ